MAAEGKAVYNNLVNKYISMYVEDKRALPAGAGAEVCCRGHAPGSFDE